eukprot:566455_1
MGIKGCLREILDIPQVVSKHDEKEVAPVLSEHKFDNLYVDMNCILHGCQNEHSDETAMLNSIYETLEYLHRVVQPSKVMFLAIDGVPPSAKMPEQRARRFRKARELLGSDAEQKDQTACRISPG